MKKVAVVLSMGLVALFTLLHGQELYSQETKTAKPAAMKSAGKFTVVEATIPEMQAAMAQGKVTARELVTQYLTRIAIYNPKLNALMAVNPKALDEADALDRERAAGHVRGPLHGIPIAIKDNIQTSDMPTTGGAMLFEGFVPSYEATLTKNLREAGAIIIAKTRLNEFAGWVTGGPTPAPANYNALTGFGLNPYDPRHDPRPGMDDRRPALTPAGSSFGGGTAVSMWAADVGTDTTGSLLGPSNVTMLAGIRPTLARISRYGVIPVTADQDMPGPIAKTVTDATILLGVLESPQADPQDPGTGVCPAPANRDYTPNLKADALKGARIGIPRAYFYEGRGRGGRGGLNPAQTKMITEVIAELKKQGAVIVDPADFPSVTEKDPVKNYANFPVCGDGDKVKGNDADCSIVLKYGFKRDLNKWLASLGPTAPAKTLTELRMWNLTHISTGAIRYGEGRLKISDEIDLIRDRDRYEADRAKDIALSRTNGFDAVIKANQLDAVMFPGSGGSDIADRAGYPSIAVPFGLLPNNPTPPFPESFHAKPGPFGVMFTGMPCSEPRLIGIAYAFEQATKRRVPPPSFP